MWGSYIGLVVGTAVAFISVGNTYGDNPIRSLMFFLNPIKVNLLLDMMPYNLAIKFAIPMALLAVLTTPLFFAIYGWGIHSIFRKLKFN